MMHIMTFAADDDDFRDIETAIAQFQATHRYRDEIGGVALGEGEGDLGARILGEICRSWMEAEGERRG